MSSRPILGVAVLLPLFLTVVGSAPAVPSNHRCTGEIGAPLSVRIEDPDGVVPGGQFQLRGTIDLDADAPRLVLRFESRGSLALDAEPVELGPYFAGESVPFEVPVICEGHGHGVVHVRAEVTDALGQPRFATRGSLYARLRPEGHRFGRVGLLSLEREAIEAGRGGGASSDAQVDQALRELGRMSPTISSAPPVSRTFTPKERRLNARVGLPGDGAAPVAAVSRGTAGDDTVLVQGNVQWQDENGNWHPVFAGNMRVEYRDGDSTEFTRFTLTDTAGNFSIVIAPDAGIGSGGIDFWVHYRLDNLFATMLGPGYEYWARSEVYEAIPGGSVVDVSLAFEAGGADFDSVPGVLANDANSVFQAATWIGAYAETDLGGLPTQIRAEVLWPSGADGSEYGFGRLSIEEEDRYDWDTIHHEYGHHVMAIFQIAGGSGGPHSVGECLAESRGKLEGTLLAWSEGWPTYFAVTGQLEMDMASFGVPRVGDVLYEDLEDTAVSYSLESQNSIGLGEDNEIAVQRMLFDLYDSNDDSRDTVSRSDNWIWNEMRSGNTPRKILSSFWGRLVDSLTPDGLRMNAIATDHGVGPALSTPLDGGLVTPESRTFSWEANIGCPDSYEGDRFFLFFLDAETFDLLLFIPFLETTSYTLSLAQLQSLTARTHDVVWVVYGQHTPDPGTAYYGESFAATVNQPPAADAGDDVAIECTAAPIPVTLDGTRSSDADGDPLTYAWSASDVAFDDATSSMPVGQFPVGTHAVTLTVSDTIQEASDNVSVAVEDTVPPEITCPPTEILECPAAPPPAATAEPTLTDACGIGSLQFEDVSVPGCGGTEKIHRSWTAADLGGHSASCEQTIAVVDTIGPALSVPAAVTLELSATGGVPVDDPRVQAWLSQASATDACGEAKLNHAGPRSFPVGETRVQFTGVDACENRTKLDSAVVVVDTTPPKVRCALDPLPAGTDDEGDDEGSDEDLRVVRFEVADHQPARATAVIELLQAGTECGRVDVTNGQVVAVRCRPACEVGFDDSLLEVEARSARLVVTGTDASGNSASCSVRLCEEAKAGPVQNPFPIPTPRK